MTEKESGKRNLKKPENGGSVPLFPLSLREAALRLAQQPANMTAGGQKSRVVQYAQSVMRVGHIYCNVPVVQ